MPAPAGPPIGLELTRAARAVRRAFDDALAKAGGSLPVWLVLISLKSQQRGNQRELAEAVGIREATLTHHRNARAAQGFAPRRRDPANRRVHLVELTDEGEQAFLRLRAAAAAFDQQLRRGIADQEVAALAGLLGRRQRNVTGDGTG